MWVWVWLALAATAYAASQSTHTRIRQNGATFGWRWQQRTPAAQGHAAQTVGHSYVRLPQSLPRTYQRDNVTPLPQEAISFNQLVEIFLLHQQYPSESVLNNQPVQLPENFQLKVVHHNIPNYEAPTKQYYYNPTPNELGYEVVYNDKQNKNTSSKPRDNIKHFDSSQTVLQVFKDHNCTKDVDKENASALRTKKLYAKPTSYQLHNTNFNFSAKESRNRPLTYKGAVNFNVEPQRKKARNKRYHYRADPTLNVKQYPEDESSVFVQSSTPKYDYFILNFNFDQTSTPNSRHSVNKAKKEKVLQTSSNEHRFALPIDVEETMYDNFKEIVNDLVSTMVPYLENGYEIVEVRDSSNDSNFYTKEENGDSHFDYVDVTTRPISQKYLAPITMALQLLNANYTEPLNTIDDHEVFDYSKPKGNYLKDKNILEIQESLPVFNTHINDVRHHEYLKEGKSNNNGTLDFAKALYNQFREVIENSKKYYDYKDDSRDNHNTDNEQIVNDAKENLESSENIETEEVKPNDSGNERKTIHRLVHVPYLIEKPLQKQVYYQVSVPTPIAVPVEVQVPVDQHQVLYPVAIERPFAVPVELGKPVTIERIVTQQMPVPYPVEKNVLYPLHDETKVHIVVPVEKQVPVERMVEKKVPLRVPYPVEKIVKKFDEKPVVVTKYVDKHNPVEKRVPFPIEKFVGKPVPIPVRMPYVIEHPLAIYNYGWLSVAQGGETQNFPQYLKYPAEQHKQRIPPPYLQKNKLEHLQYLQNQYAQYLQNLKERQQKNITASNWGNIYASSFQYINNYERFN